MVQELERKLHRIPQEGIATPEEIASIVPRPDLPIITALFSATPDGVVINTGGPGIPGVGRMNGHIEDILRIVASKLKPNNSSLGDDVLEFTIHADTPEEYTRRSRRWSDWDRQVYYVEPQEGEEFERQLAESGIKKIAINKAGERRGHIPNIISMLKPETQFSIMPVREDKNYLVIEI